MNNTKHDVGCVDYGIELQIQDLYCEDSYQNHISLGSNVVLKGNTGTVLTHESSYRSAAAAAAAAAAKRLCLRNVKCFVVRSTLNQVWEKHDTTMDGALGIRWVRYTTCKTMADVNIDS
jgi:hypothetical protein